jgi:hypothetical protein
VNELMGLRREAGPFQFGLHCASEITIQRGIDQEPNEPLANGEEA